MNTDTLKNLKLLLAKLEKNTGITVRFSPSEREETCFEIDYCGERVNAYIDGKNDEICTHIRLIQYIIAENEGNESLPQKEELLKNILLGEGGKWEVFRFATKHALPALSCFAADVVPGKAEEEVYRQISGTLADSESMVIKMDSRRIAVVKFDDDGQSPLEFGRFLFQSLYEELGVRASIGLGSAGPFQNIAASYSQAVSAVRLSGIFHSKGEVHSYREFMLATMLEDLGKTRVKDYMTQFGISDTEKVFSDPELTETAEEFLANSLNLSETSRALFLHRNTLMYRLDKIERLTGLNIRNFSDAVTFRVISVLYKMLMI